jgi:hypothetical protein
MLSGLPLMRQVVGFLNCLKKNGLSNEKYVPRKRPRDFSQAGTLVVDIAAEQGQDRLADEREKPNATRPETERSPLCFAFPKQSGAPYDNTGCIGIPGQLRHFLQEACRNVHFSSPHGQVGLSVQAGTNKSPPVARREKRRLVRQGATIFKKEAIR